MYLCTFPPLKIVTFVTGSYARPPGGAHLLAVSEPKSGVALKGSSRPAPFTWEYNRVTIRGSANRLAHQPCDDYFQSGRREGRDDGVEDQMIKTGIAGLSVSRGTYMYGFFRGRKERDDVAFPFLREGLRCGDRCLWAVETADRDALANIKIAAVSAGDQLEIVLSSDVYSRRGDFAVAGALDDRWAATSLADSEFGARAVSEMTRAVIELRGSADLIRYESELNRFAPRHRQVLLCLYELDHFRGDLFFDIMKTHPNVLLGSTVLENLYYLPPN